MKILTAYNDTDNKVEITAKRCSSPNHYMIKQYRYGILYNFMG